MCEQKLNKGHQRVHGLVCHESAGQKYQAANNWVQRKIDLKGFSHSMSIIRAERFQLTLTMYQYMLNLNITKSNVGKLI